MSQPIVILRDHHGNIPKQIEKSHLNPKDIVGLNGHILPLDVMHHTLQESFRNGPVMYSSDATHSAQNHCKDIQPEVVRYQECFEVIDLTGISYLIMHDHDYCAKLPISPNENLAVNQVPKFDFGDHNYCHALLSPIEEIQPSSATTQLSIVYPSDSIALPQSEVLQNGPPSMRQDSCEIEGEIFSVSGPLKPGVTDCDFILPDVARDSIATCHYHSCTNATEISSLKLQLQQKSVALNACLREVESLKDELGIAKQHIDNLRAQLEENTHALCAYFAMDGERQVSFDS